MATRRTLLSYEHRDLYHPMVLEGYEFSEFYLLILTGILDCISHDFPRYGGTTLLPMLATVGRLLPCGLIGSNLISCEITAASLMVVLPRF